MSLLSTNQEHDNIESGKKHKQYMIDIRQNVVVLIDTKTAT